MHKLVFIAAAGLGLCAACVGTALAIGGDEFDFGSGEGFSLFDGRPRCQAVAGATNGTREMAWDGSDQAGLNFLGQASYRPGAGDRLVASGDPQVLAHLRIRKGTVELDCRGWRDRTREIAVTLPGRRFDKFSVSGGRLTIDGLEQHSVAIAIAGSGKVQASGKLEEEIRASIAGSGDMNLGDITARRGRMEIAGSGTMRARNMRLADEFKVSVAGSGRAEMEQLTTRDARAEIAGSGTIIAESGTVDALKISIAGSGRGDFGRLASRTAKVEIGGHGDVDIAPTDLADVDIGGSGDVTLHSNPRELKTDIGGSGKVHRLAGG